MSNYNPDEVLENLGKAREQLKRQEHYTSLTHEPIDIIRGTPHFAGFCWGNCIKYLFRYQNKGGKLDLLKAAQYLEWLIDADETDDEDSGPVLELGKFGRAVQRKFDGMVMDGLKEAAVYDDQMHPGETEMG